MFMCGFFLASELFLLRDNSTRSYFGINYIGIMNLFSQFRPKKQDKIEPHNGKKSKCLLKVDLIGG